ncbi:MAG: hypothetical protein JWM76_3304 [Pseudonocardiales bacterium]|nr:hypothetical protein [Pseudonocardiales bacterium]
MHADRTNRSMLVLLAVLLIAAGGLGAATSFGAFGKRLEHRHLSQNRVWTFFGQHGDWLWPVAGLIAMIIVVLALRWLRTLLFSTDRSGDLRIASAKGSGKTTLHPGAVSDAVVAEIKSYRGVQFARARLIGDPEEPDLVVLVTLEDTADLVALRHRIETGALTHARQALDNPDLPIQLDLAVSTKRTTRVS